MKRQSKRKLNVGIIETFVTEIIADINEDVTDIKLIKDISERITSELPEKRVGTLDSCKVYLFIYNNIMDFDLKPCKNINKAIKDAVNYIENVKIIYRGQVIKWDVINNETAFYINPFNNKLKVVKLEDWAC